MSTAAIVRPCADLAPAGRRHPRGLPHRNRDGDYGEQLGRSTIETGLAPALPPLGILTPVRAGEHYNFFGRGGEHDAIGEPAEESVPHRTVHLWELLRIPLDGGDDCISRAEELRTQTAASAFVPLCRCEDLLQRDWSNNEPGSHGPNRSFRRWRASVQGIAEAGSARCSAKRRSSSARCSSEIDSAAESAGMLSQSSWASWMRSASLRRSKSEARVLIETRVARREGSRNGSARSPTPIAQAHSASHRNVSGGPTGAQVRSGRENLDAECRLHRSLGYARNITLVGHAWLHGKRKAGAAAK